MKSRKARRNVKRAYTIRPPSVKAIRKGAASFFRAVTATGKKIVGSLRRMTCRRR